MGFGIAASAVVGAFIAVVKTSALATPQWGGVAGLIEPHAKDSMSIGAAAVSLALAVTVMLVPPTAYELLMRARDRAARLGSQS
jgi:hypothetical protein